MKLIAQSITIILGVFLAYYLPQLIWNINWEDLIELLKDNQLDELFKAIADIHNISYQTAKQWAIEKIIITGTIIIIYFTIAYWIFKNNPNKTNNINKSKNENYIPKKTNILVLIILIDILILMTSIDCFIKKENITGGIIIAITTIITIITWKQILKHRKLMNNKGNKNAQ